MKLSSIKIGMRYSDVRNKILKSKNLIIGALPVFCGSNYEMIEELNTKETIYVLWDYDTGIITDVTKEYCKAVKSDKAERNLKEILNNNVY